MQRNRHWDDDDRLYDQIHQGDRDCKVCGQPSYAMFRHEILCRKHYEQAVKEAKNDKQ